MPEYEDFDTEELIEWNAKVREQISKLEGQSAGIEEELARRGREEIAESISEAHKDLRDLKEILDIATNASGKERESDG